VAVLPPLTAANRPDWQVSRRKRFRKAIAALHPTDRVQGYIAVRMVMLRHLVKNLTGRARARWNSPEDTRWLGRQAAKLMRTGDRLERALRREQKIAVRRGGGRAAASPGLPAKEAACRNDAMQQTCSLVALSELWTCGHWPAACQVEPEVNSPFSTNTASVQPTRAR